MNSIRRLIHMFRTIDELEAKTILAAIFGLGGAIALVRLLEDSNGKLVDQYSTIRLNEKTLARLRAEIGGARDELAEHDYTNRQPEPEPEIDEKSWTGATGDER